MSNPDKFIDLLRHGKAIGGNCFRGSQDDLLSQQGLLQLQVASHHHHDWDCVISSPLQRCLSFAKQLAEERQIPLIIEAELRERHFGDWEGKQAKQIPSEDLSQFWHNPTAFTPEGAEPFSDFAERVINIWNDIQQGAYKSSLIITHAGIIRTIIGHLLNMPEKSLILLEVPYASHSRIRVPVDGLGHASLVFHKLTTAS